MAEPLLNKDEINDLLKTPRPAGEITSFWQGDVTKFDFLGAALKKDEKIQAVSKFHTTAAKLMGRPLSRVCEREMNVEFVRHEMINTEEALSQINSEVALPYLWREPARGSEGLFVLDKSLFFILFNSLFGGKRALEKKEALTKLEINFLDKIMYPIAEALQTGWRNAGQWTFGLQGLLIDQDAVVSLGWTFDAFKAFFKLTVTDMEPVEFYALLPKEMLNIVGGGEKDNQKSENTQATGHKDKTWVEAVKIAISHMPLPVTVDLAQIKMQLDQVLKMKPEDVYEIIIPKDALHPVYVDNHLMFKSSIGGIDGQKAVKITNKLTGGPNE